jgi:hypothetical protein
MELGYKVKNRINWAEVPVLKSLYSTEVKDTRITMSVDINIFSGPSISGT